LPKTKFSSVVTTFLLCMGFWMLLTWSLDAQELIAGAIVSLVAALFASRFFIHEKAAWFFRPGRLFALLWFVLVVYPIELLKANWDMAKRCYGGCKKLNPGVVKVPVNLTSDYGMSMLANCITNTPGTISLDIAEQDGQVYYYIHWIDVTETDPEKAGEIIKGNMEKWMRRIWEK